MRVIDIYQRWPGQSDRAECGPDVTNWQVGITEFIQKSHVLADLCEATGRDPATVRRTHAPNFQLFESESEFRRWRQSEDRGMSAKEVEAYIRDRGAFYGTSEAIQEIIEEFKSAGCRGFMIFCNKAPSLEGQRNSRNCSQ